MAYPIFPVSPLPAGLERTKSWGENDSVFDSGASITMTAFQKPLYRYSIPWSNITEVKQQVIFDFFDTVRGRTMPFLLKDPYEYRVNSVLAVQSGFASGSGTVQLFDTKSFMVRADTTTIGSLFSSLSGFVTLGSEFSYEQDTGVLTVNTKAVNDVWGVRSMEYWRKVKFDGDYQENATLWKIWNVSLKFREDT